MIPLDTLIRSVAAEPALDTSVSMLVNSLADRIKATSNDQNIQKLARELKNAAPALVEAIARKPALLTTD